MSEPKVLLKVNNLMVAYGGIEAVKGITMEVREGELVSLIGSNGAGKTTTMKAITGTLAASSGSIEYLGQKHPRPRRLGLGQARLGDGARRAWRLHSHEHLGKPANGCVFARRQRRYCRRCRSCLLLVPALERAQNAVGWHLVRGEQQMLAMGRALLSRPKVLLLDEPSMGLSPLMVDKIFEVIQEVASMGVTLLLVEQNASRALKIHNVLM
jgi:branched-chain amino acid transport system ATP-binding protein